MLDPKVRETIQEGASTLRWAQDLISRWVSTSPSTKILPEGHRLSRDSARAVQIRDEFDGAVHRLHPLLLTIQERSLGFTSDVDRAKAQSQGLDFHRNNVHGYEDPDGDERFSLPPASPNQQLRSADVLQRFRAIRDAMHDNEFDHLTAVVAELRGLREQAAPLVEECESLEAAYRNAVDRDREIDDVLEEV